MKEGLNVIDVIKKCTKIGCWLLAVSYWLLAFTVRLLTFDF
jgi:hypothetical protein